VKTVKTYSTKTDADLAKNALAATGVPSLVIGIAANLAGGVIGVQLLVPDEYAEAALGVLEVTHLM
jgi:hypothetical protein